MPDRSKQAQGAGGNQEGLGTWISEIAWRDFYINILYHYTRVSARAFKPKPKLWSGTPRRQVRSLEKRQHRRPHRRRRRANSTRPAGCTTACA